VQSIFHWQNSKGNVMKKRQPFKEVMHPHEKQSRHGPHTCYINYLEMDHRAKCKTMKYLYNNIG
jgi:hypothetical protein